MPGIKFHFKGKPTEVKCLDISGGHTSIDGIKLPWMVSQRALNALKEYEIRHDDVWVTTYPKAGKYYVYDHCNFFRPYFLSEKKNSLAFNRTEKGYFRPNRTMHQYIVSDSKLGVFYNNLLKIHTIIG